MEFLETIAKIPPDKLVFVDETGCEEFFCRTHGRAERGVKVEGLKRGKKFERVNVVSGQISSSHGVQFIQPCVFRGTTDSLFFEAWFKILCSELSGNGFYVQLDNASFHRKNQLHNIAEGFGVGLVFQPPYSPDLNDIEKSWANLKRALPDIVPNHSCLFDAVCDYFESHN